MEKQEWQPSAEEVAEATEEKLGNELGGLADDRKVVEHCNGAVFRVRRVFMLAVVAWM